MSFSLANPTGWTTGDLLTEDQINQLDAEHAAAIDGSNGGSYTLGNPLSITGATVTFDAIVSPTISGVTTFANDVVMADDLIVGDDATVSGDLFALNSAYVTDNLEIGDYTQVGGDLWVGDDVTVIGDAAVGGGVTVTGDVIAAGHKGPLCSVDTLRALKNLRLPTSSGADSDHNITVGVSGQFILADALTASHIWTILDTGAGDGDFFVFFNKSPGQTLTINAPIGTILTITNGNAGLAWRHGTVWYGQVISAT